jgi:RNA polymerase sigma-70 factor (ECF subfamily)
MPIFRQTQGAATLSGKKHAIHPICMEEVPDHDSWKEWFERHGPRLLLYARQCTRSLADAEDIVQDAFVRYWRNQRKLRGEPLPLLVTSVRRAAVDLARRDGRRAVREMRADGQPEESGRMFETPLEGDDRRAGVEAALRRLPEEQREVLALKIWGGLTFEEIGSQLGQSPNTAASRYRYGLEALRRELPVLAVHG